MIHLARVWSNHQVASQHKTKDPFARFSSCWHIGADSNLIHVRVSKPEHEEDHARVTWLQQEGPVVIVESAPGRLPLREELDWTQEPSVVRFLYAAEQFLVIKALSTLHPQVAEQAGEMVSEAMRTKRRSREATSR